MGQRASFDDTTIKLQVGEIKTITDTNGVLEKYETIDINDAGIRIMHTKGENTMQFLATEECTVENYRITDNKCIEWGFIKEETEERNSTVYIEFKEGVQDQIYSMDYNDPVTLKLSLEIEAKGRLELIKTNDNSDLINSSVFIITGPNNYRNEVTVSDGKIVLEDLAKGIYTPTGYALDTQTYTVQIESGKTTTKTIINKEPTRYYNCRKKK